ncbi:peptidoglycan-binding domain-containing protein [Shouchella clausii]|uniref:peptidoglycan-binding domain-containing protein n=2 Tax=Shouchella clausii TaxID=79880 RepID=UPI003463531B
MFQKQASVVDGEHGPLTEQAIERFQEENEQYVDGIASPVTMNLLDLEAFHPSSTNEIEAYLESQDRAVSIIMVDDSEIDILNKVL